MVKAFVPLRFELGEAFQFDWSEEHLLIGGIWRKILAAHLKLCASRTFVLQAYPTQSHEMLFEAQTRAFIALGGIPRRGIYDNIKTTVDRVKSASCSSDQCFALGYLQIRSRPRPPLAVRL